jgi:hypothetical protein
MHTFLCIVRKQLDVADEETTTKSLQELKKA